MKIMEGTFRDVGDIFNNYRYIKDKKLIFSVVVKIIIEK